MSWSLLLLKQVPKNWTTKLPANDPTQWAQIFKFHSLTQDKEKNGNIPLDNNEFINDMVKGNYPRDGLRGTIKQLEEWKEDRNAWLNSPALRSLSGGQNPITRPKHIRTIIDRFVKEVLPKLEKDREAMDKKRTKGTQFKRKTDWNNTESIIEALTGINDKDEKEQRELLDEFNDSISKHKGTSKVNEKLKNWGTQNNIPTLLRTLGYNNRGTLLIKRLQPSYTKEKKEKGVYHPATKKYGKMDEEIWANFKLKPLTIGDDTLEFTKTSESITSTSFDKGGEGNDNLTKVRDAIEEQLKTRLDIKMVSIPLVKIFGYITWGKKTVETEGKTGKLSQAELITEEQKEMKKYKVNPSFNFKHAHYFYNNIVTSKSKLIPQVFKKLNLITDRNPILIKLLGNEYSNTETMYANFMRDGKEQYWKNEKVIKAHYVNQIIEQKGRGFEGIDGKQNSTKLTGLEYDNFKLLNLKGKKKYILEQMDDIDSSLYTLINNKVDEDLDNIVSYLPYVVNEVEIDFINKLDDYTKTMETIETQGTERGTGLFEPLGPLFNTQVQTKNKLKIIDKSAKGILDEFISGIRMLDSLTEVRGVFGKTHSRMINRLRKTPPKEDIQLPDSKDDEKFSGLNQKERDIAEVVSLAYSAKENFRDALTISDKAQSYSFKDILAIITKVGRKFTNKLGEINTNTYVNIIRDLDYDAEKDYDSTKDWEETKETIKGLVVTLDRDIPIVRDFLKEEAENMVEGIIENAVIYLERETKAKAKKGKTKGTTRLLSRLKNNGLIVEDK